ncbi:MAG: AbrB/MazE/SpoVT family DNA-binding domain-containing protein [Sphingomonadaceae bacterium]|nr:AbrB/MazE/SpoVT family DNA-binding domain-containing protein [Sphingomonadaceae bacterium]
MSKEYRAKVFKSGNSVALRLPKALGLKDGDEMILREERSGFVFKPAEKPRKTIDVSGFWGKAPGARLIPHGDFDERPSAIARREALKSR